MKSSLYRALRLLADYASGRVISSSLVRVDSIPSLWAGPEHVAATVRSGPISGYRAPHDRADQLSQLGFASDDFPI